MLVLSRVKTKVFKGALATIFTIVLLYIITGINTLLSSRAGYNKERTVSTERRDGNAIQLEYSKPISQLEKLKRTNALHFAYSVVEFEGKVDKISVDKGNVLKDKFKNEIQLVIRVGKKGDKITQYYPPDSLDRIKLYEVSDGKNSKITFSDLSLGDEVVVKNTFNNSRSYPNSLVESIITIK